MSSPVKEIKAHIFYFKGIKLGIYLRSFSQSSQFKQTVSQLKNTICKIPHQLYNQLPATIFLYKNFSQAGEFFKRGEF